VGRHRRHPNSIDDWASQRAIKLVRASLTSEAWPEAQKALMDAVVIEELSESVRDDTNALVQRRLESLIYNLAFVARHAVTIAANAEEMTEDDYLDQMERDLRR
jgi:hypothetical protein